MLAVEAGVGEPLNTNAVAELDGLVLSVGADGNDDTDTLRANMSGNTEFTAKMVRTS